MSLLEDAYKSFKGLVGYEEPKPPQLSKNKLSQLYAQRSGLPINQQGGVMNASVQSPVNQSAMELAMEKEAYGASRQEGWKLGDTYIGLDMFGANVHSTPRLLGSKSAWKEFANQTTKTFEEFGLQVDQKRFFPTPVHLSSSEGRDIPYGTVVEGKEFNEMNWLNKDRDTNIEPRPGGGWFLSSPNSSNAGLMSMVGLTSPSFDSYNPGRNLGDNTYVGVSTKGASLSSGTPSVTTTETFGGGAPDFRKISKDTTTQAIYAQQNVTGHEYGHYLDVWMGNGTPLNQIVMSLGVNTAQPTENDWLVAWMNDPRTAHLDVVDNINTVMQGAKVNNPREILGKLYVTAMLNPTRIDGQPFSSDPTTNMSENIVRAMGVFFNPDQTDDEGHIQGIKDMRGDVITSIANLLNQ